MPSYGIDVKIITTNNKIINILNKSYIIAQTKKPKIRWALGINFVYYTTKYGFYKFSELCGLELEFEAKR